MSKKANPTIIGAFIIGAIALIILSIVLIGGGRIFSERQVYISYFDGSLQGLRVGANVTFRGVRIGQVREVFVRFDENTLQFDSPVIFEIEEGSMRTVHGREYSETEGEELFNQLIENGLRAQLRQESFVTGQLLIDLDYHPGTPIVFRDTETKYHEIPTVRNDIQLVIENFQKFLVRLKDFPVEEVINDIQSSIKGINKIVNSPELENTLKGFDQLVNAEETQQLTASLQNSIDKLDATLLNVQNFIQNIDQQVDPLVEDFGKSMEEFQAAATEIQTTFTEIRSKVQDETIRHELSTAIDEFRNAARSFRIFVDFLERHPEAFISGKPNTQ